MRRVWPSGGLLSAFFRFAGFQQMPIWPGIDLPKLLLEAFEALNAIPLERESVRIPRCSRIYPCKSGL